MRNRPPYQPAAEVDVVWVLSQPGTVKQPSNDGVYKGILNDLIVVQAGINLVRAITGLRLAIGEESITKEDIQIAGPIFFYNGEDASTSNFNYSQNEDLAVMAAHPDFPIPRSKMIIEHIDEIGTPAQITGFANFLHAHPGMRKVAVVSMAPHSERVSRYLQHYRNLYPSDVVLENAPVAERRIPVGGTLREIKKIIRYYGKGDLAREPYFK